MHSLYVLREERIVKLLFGLRLRLMVLKWCRQMFRLAIWLRPVSWYRTGRCMVLGGDWSSTSGPCHTRTQQSLATLLHIFLPVWLWQVAQLWTSCATNFLDRNHLYSSSSSHSVAELASPWIFNMLSSIHLTPRIEHWSVTDYYVVCVSRRVIVCRWKTDSCLGKVAQLSWVSDVHVGLKRLSRCDKLTIWQLTSWLYLNSLLAYK